LFRHLKRIVNLDAEVSASNLQPCMREQQLNGPQVLRSPVNQRDLFPPHGVRAIRRVVRADGRDPAMNQPSILPGRKMRRSVQPTRKQYQFSPYASLSLHFECQGKQLERGIRIL